ncbi:MAG TPA: O-antigen ligase family protein [Puia sp.]|nr:O-antigen ligase family protein [Puia sp.]
MRLPKKKLSISKDKLKTTADLGILAMAFIIPSGFYALDLAVLALIGICRILQGSIRLDRLRRPVVFLPIAFYLYIFSGFFFSQHKGDALSAWSEKLPYLLYPLFIGCAAGVEKALISRALRLFVISVCISMALAFLYAGIDTWVAHTATIQMGESIYNKFSWYGLTRVFPDWHPTCVSLFCNMAIAILLYHALQGDRRLFRKHGYLAATIIFLSICVCLLYSVTGIVTYACLLVFFLFRWMHAQRLSFTVRIGTCLAVAALLAGLLYANPMAMDKVRQLREKGWTATDKQDERNVLTIRLAKWITHLDIFQHHPLFGTTAGDIRDMRKETYRQKGYTDLAAYNYNAHDQYIEVLATYGIAGAILFFAMLGAACALAFRNTLLTAFMISSLLIMMTESLLERQQGLNFFLFFYSLLTLSGVPGGESPLRVLRRPAS